VYDVSAVTIESGPNPNVKNTGKPWRNKLMPRMTKKYLEFRKKEIEARFNDPDFVYHNTMDRERERKSNGYYEDTRKRIDE
jgi:hypothetical protein